MKIEAATALRRELGVSLRLEAACDFSAVRAANLAVREWLAQRGLPEADLGAWELALAEASNNAVEYASPEARKLPVVIEVFCGAGEVEARITDHTPGFEFPADVELPDADSEGGRGLFLIKSLSERVTYLRSPAENQLVLRRRHTAVAPPAAPDAAELRRQLAESEIAVSEMGEELASSYESLVAMFRYSAELGTNADLREFTGRLLADLLQLTETDAAVVRLYSENRLETFYVLPAEARTQLPPLDRLDAADSVELEAAATREDVWFGGERPLAAGDPLRAIAGARFGLVHAFGSHEQRLGTLALIRRGSDAPLRSAQVNILHTLADFLAIQMVNTRLLAERTQSSLTRRELEIAANIQSTLLPVSLPAVPPFTLAASCTNAREVGGDFYDVLRVGEEGLLIVIGDVMGKGVPAALFAAVLRSALRSMPGLFSEPAALLASVNRALYEDFSRVDMFATAKVVFLDLPRHRFVSASAGHCPLLIWQSGQPTAAAADVTGLPLGIEMNVDYQQSVTPFPPGAVALLFTDGLSELQNRSGEMFGIEGLEKILPALSPEKVPSAKMSAALRAELDAYRDGAAFTDDQTFVILRHEL